MKEAHPAHRQLSPELEDRCALSPALACNLGRVAKTKGLKQGLKIGAEKEHSVEKGHSVAKNPTSSASRAEDFFRSILEEKERGS